MKQKLSLCSVLIFSPRVLLLDEPTTGLDPISRREFWHLLAHVADNGVTTLVATPNFTEAELCDRVALLHQGKIIRLGKPDSLREQLGLSRIQIRANDLDTVNKVINNIVEKDLNEIVVDVNTYGDRIDVLTRSKEHTTAVLRQGLAPFKHSLTCEEPTLENVFVTNLRGQGFKEPAALPMPLGQTQGDSRGREEVAILATHLSKRFGSFEAVCDLGLAIRYGEIYGLLGANGAGKTTTMKMLCGLLQPSSGNVSLCGLGTHVRSSRMRRRIGYMSQRLTLYDDLSAEENLNYYASAYSITGSARQQKIDWVISICGLGELATVPVKTLPEGLKQRISFGAAVMHEPDVLFLDEPTAGVDPLVRRQMWKLIRSLAERGTAILVTTHFLDDAEYCHKLGLMVSGKVVAEGSPENLRNRSERLLEIVVNDVHKAFSILSDKIDASLLSVFPRRIHAQIDDRELSEDRVLGYLSEHGIQFERRGQVPPSLEDAFVQIVRSARC